MRLGFGLCLARARLRGSDRAGFCGMSSGAWGELKRRKSDWSVEFEIVASWGAVVLRPYMGGEPARRRRYQGEPDAEMRGAVLK
jgi:hypothetical protein